MIDNTLAPREQVVRLKVPSTQVMMKGTPLESTAHFYDGALGRIEYKHSWLKRVWYTSRIGRQFWTRS